VARVIPMESLMCVEDRSGVGDCKRVVNTVRLLLASGPGPRARLVGALDDDVAGWELRRRTGMGFVPDGGALAAPTTERSVQSRWV